MPQDVMWLCTSHLCTSDNVSLQQKSDTLKRANVHSDCFSVQLIDHVAQPFLVFYTVAESFDVTHETTPAHTQRIDEENDKKSYGANSRLEYPFGNAGSHKRPHKVVQTNLQNVCNA